MKKKIALILTIFALVQVTYSQSETQLMSQIDEIVNKIKNEKASYRKIPSDFVSTYIDTAFKKGAELIIYEVIKTIENKEISDYYFDNGQLIYLEVRKNNALYEKTYYKECRIISKFRNENKVDFSEEDLNLLQAAMLKSTSELIKRYKDL